MSCLLAKTRTALWRMSGSSTNRLRAVIICISERTECYPTHPLTTFREGSMRTLNSLAAFVTRSRSWLSTT